MNNQFNIIINNEHLVPNKDLIKPLFGDEDTVIIPNVDMFDILTACEIFKSKGQARKNWKKTGQDVPPGFTDITGIGKLNKRLTIWNPIED